MFYEYIDVAKIGTLNVRCKPTFIKYLIAKLFLYITIVTCLLPDFLI